MIPVEKRYIEYNKEHCWQYDIRLNNREDDLAIANLTEEYVSKLKVSDFEFRVVTEKDQRQELIRFIERHEWLGKISMYATHWFACYHKDILAGVIIMSMPNAYSKMLGEDTRKIEREISRGACVSWSPKNLASALLMWSVRWMVENTNYRLFIAYSDPSAKELGTIYQACNFMYLGQTAGAKKMYINPYSGKLTSDRFFRARSAYKKYAIELGIPWGNNWNKDSKMLWDNIPDDIEKQLREHSKLVQSNAIKVDVPLKHKYAMVLGKDKGETKKLKRLFKQNVNTMDYPKER
jgi:hypothetical protein